MATPLEAAARCNRLPAQRLVDLARERDRMSAELSAMRKLLGDVREAAFDSSDVHDGFTEIRRILMRNWDTATPPGRAFDLVRHQDHSHVSGVGRVAEGYVFEDGQAVLRWLSGADASTNVYASVEAIQRIHGHGGATEVRYR